MLPEYEGSGLDSCEIDRESRPFATQWAVKSEFCGSHGVTPTLTVTGVTYNPSLPFATVILCAMFKTALRAARPAVLAARTANKQQASRAFSTTLRVSSGGPPPPQLYGPGAKPGSVPTDLDQATGLERLQLLGEIEGINVFDEGPLDSSRIGTKADPVLVPSYVRLFPFVCILEC